MEKNTIKRGNYYIYRNKLLGKGSFAETFLACSINNQSEMYACKLIDKRQVDTIQSVNKEEFKNYFITRLQEQIKAWKELQHPYIVKFYDIIETQNSIYMMLEYCEEGTLEKYMNNNLKVKTEIALEFSKQIVSACAYLYKKGIIHRDIKPANILLSKGKIKISDFGLAKIIDQDEINTLKTGTIAGSPCYMAPQVLSGEKYNISCDVWSVGVLLYRIFIGNLPLGITNNDKSQVKILSTIGKGALLFSKELKSQIREILKRMLEVDCTKRITILEVEEILKKL